jgi:hypothetical protein
MKLDEERGMKVKGEVPEKRCRLSLGKLIIYENKNNSKEK